MKNYFIVIKSFRDKFHISAKKIMKQDGLLSAFMRSRDIFLVPYKKLFKDDVRILEPGTIIKYFD